MFCWDWKLNEIYRRGFSSEQKMLKHMNRHYRYSHIQSQSKIKMKFKALYLTTVVEMGNYPPKKFSTTKLILCDRSICFITREKTKIFYVVRDCWIRHWIITYQSFKKLRLNVPKWPNRHKIAITAVFICKIKYDCVI
jgi:hypothetical protein